MPTPEQVKAVAEEYVAAFAQRERGGTFAAALARPADVPGLAARSAHAIEGFNTLITGLRELSEAVPVADLTEAVLDRTGYIEALEQSSDLQDASRIENLEELVSVAREYDGIHMRGEGEVGGTLADFLEQVSLVADADQIPEGEDHGGLVPAYASTQLGEEEEEPVDGARRRTGRRLIAERPGRARRQ